MDPLIAVLVPIGASVLSATGLWIARVERRLSGHDIVLTEREKQASERHDEIVERLSRIERKQDAANGRH